jgi:hypothetical protein
MRYTLIHNINQYILANARRDAAPGNGATSMTDT